MAQCTLVLVAALLINTLSYCSAENVYCVTPTATSCSSCPHNSTHCATLSEYAQKTELYFTSNTTMVFLPGDHVLDTNITVANVSRLTMRGESSSGNRATVVCSGSVGLSFTSIVDFKIDFLTFASCSRKYIGTLSDFHLTVVYGAILLQSSQCVELVNCSFSDNDGTALIVINADVTLSGNTFTQNRASTSPGGAIIAYNHTVLNFSGINNFINNSARQGGGAIFTSHNTVLGFNGTNNFINNSGGEGSAGGAMFITSTVLSCSGTNNFINNFAHYGGAIFTLYYNTVLNFSGTNNFINNSAVDSGGAIYTYDTISFNGTTNFINNLANWSGGAIYIYAVGHTAVLSFNGISNFINNSAYYDGGAIYALYNTVLSFSGINNFIDNIAISGGAIYAESNTTLTFNGTIYFTNNGYHVGRIDTLTTGITKGGGVYLGFRSTFSILPNTSVYWENNHANLGGAIYVYDNIPIRYCPSTRYSRRVTSELFVPQEECFFQLLGQNLIDVQLVFKNNSADAAGSVLYGGTIDNCNLIGMYPYDSGRVFNKLVHTEDDNTNSNISSLPFHICPCINNFPNCRSYFHYPRTVYPGEMFQVSVVAVGQRDGTVPSRVISTVEDTNPLDSQYWLQQATNTCTTFNYSVFSLSQSVAINLYPEGSPCSTSRDKLQIEVTLFQNCPPGFNISESARSCACESKLQRYTNSCNITNGVGQITRDSGQQFWVGYDNQSDGVILHPRCPFDYCVNDKVAISPNNTDIQCEYYRSGLLCGACKEGYSLVLGTSHCKQCTNSHLALLIPFALMGVALVFFLFVSKLTVATGTLSSLVFYANIVGVNHTIFLPADSTVVFSMFIAWLNLDFGIETCFYDGMDAYSKTWLQFVFPVYIWLLVGLVALISNYSPRFANMLGNNPVSVLATLILLSYTKILRTLIAVLYVTHLEYPPYNQYPSYSRKVWLYDANIDYLSGKRIPLFLVAVFIFLFLPYTLLLLCSQWLQSISHLRLFSWVNRVKPFMDSYHAPYKAKHRYWPGLLLVLRFVLLLVFAFNPQHDPSVNLLAIQVGVGILQMWAWVSGGVYRNWCLDALEGLFALNLIILAAATFFVNNSGGDQLAVGYTSVSISFVKFFGILAFQLANMTGITQYLKRKCTTLKVAIRNPQKAEAEPRSPTGSLPERLNNPEEYELSRHTPQEQTS